MGGGCFPPPSLGTKPPPSSLSWQKGDEATSLGLEYLAASAQ